SEVLSAFRAEAWTIGAAKWLHRCSRHAILPDRFRNVDDVVLADQEAVGFGPLARSACAGDNVDLLEVLLLKCNLFGVSEWREATAADCFDDNGGVDPHKNRPGRPQHLDGAGVDGGLGIDGERTARA